jgi:aminopeptidase N
MRLVYEATRPTEGLHLVAGRWRRFESDHAGVRVAAYVYPDDADLAEPYMAAIRRYLDLYNGWLGAYAYDRFAVVENFFSTGYGMAGFTVLGQDVMRLPFIVDTSLGHEVAHGWWGNGVFVSEDGGNWCEGLTTYVADYHYKKTQSAEAAAEYRREVCRDFTNYVAQAGADFALSEFAERTTPATRAVGYGKTMMVFHMLEERVGKEKFDAALRRVYKENVYREADWSTWRAAFSKESGEDLGWFFDQWVSRPGAPLLELKDVKMSAAAEGGGFVVSGTLVQTGGSWRLDVPIVVEAGGASERHVVSVSGATSPFEVRVPFRPEVMRIDPAQNVFRRLDAAEMPPVVSKLLGDPATVFVVDDTSGEELRAAYAEMAATLMRSGMGKVVDASKATAEELGGRNVFLLGYPSAGTLRALLAALPSEVAIGPDGFRVAEATFEQPGAALLAIGRSPSDASRAVGVFRGLSPDAVRAAGRKLVHYGKYSYLAFVDGKNVAKGVARVEGGPLVATF